MAYNDLREWMGKLEDEGELARIKAKVDWNLEIGGILHTIGERGGPAVLFENVKDYENTLCRELFASSLASYTRIALMMGLPKDTPPQEIILTFMDRIKKPVKPQIVGGGAVKGNILKGDEVNLMEFPAAKWHYRDGGRYIGTCHGVITRDPETGWVNVGMYRNMLHDRDHISFTVVHGQHVWRHWRKHRKLNRKTMEAAIVVGWDPVLPMIACAPQPPEVNEYDIMGGVRQRPVELVRCETVDLEVPATAEIVLEGEVSLDVDSFRVEGPFGEYTGYYCSVPKPAPVMTIKCISFRSAPVLQGSLTGVPPKEDSIMSSINMSALLWDHLNEQMVGVRGVNAHPSTGGTNVFVQIDNSYVGQPQQVAMAIWGKDTFTNYCKNVMVVDEDIDIFDLNKLAWALAYRVDPIRDITSVPGVIGMLDPVVHPRDIVGRTTKKGNKLLIDATKYFGNPRTDDWFGEKFPPVVYPDEKTIRLVQKRWEEYGIKVSNK